MINSIIRFRIQDIIEHSDNDNIRDELRRLWSDLDTIRGICKE